MAISNSLAPVTDRLVLNEAAVLLAFYIGGYLVHVADVLDFGLGFAFEPFFAE